MKNLYKLKTTLVLFLLVMAGGVVMGQNPTVTTVNPPIDITASSATLKGTVNPNGLATTVYFDYGTTTAYGSTALVSGAPLSGSINIDVSAGILGLD